MTTSWFWVTVWTAFWIGFTVGVLLVTVAS